MNVNKFFSLPLSETIAEFATEQYYLQLVISFSSYYKKYLNYTSVFDKKNMLVLRNKDLKESPVETMRNVYNFLGITPIETKEFNKIGYSLGTNINDLNAQTYDHLAEILYPDYYQFCETSGSEYTEVKQSSKSSLTAHKDVHVGNDGWLFLRQGSNRLIEYYEKPDLFNDELVQKWSDLLSKRIEYFGEKGMDYVHLFVPDKLTIYPEHYGTQSGYPQGGPLRKLDQAVKKLKNHDVRDHIVNPIDYFNEQKASLQLFWKTDTHWTFHGAYCAYELICSKLGVEPNKELVNRPKSTGRLAMDLGSKLNPALKEDVAFFKVLKDAKRIYANDIVTYKEANRLENCEGLHMGSHVIFRNESAAYSKRVLIFGDSFSEYRPYLLTAALAETFYEVSFVWSTSLDMNYLEKYDPDIVITEIAERFMPRVPTDAFDLETYVRNTLTSQSYLSVNKKVTSSEQRKD